MIGLTGSHRTGKTTLAKAYAEKHGIKACITSSSHVFERMGYSPKADLPFKTRLEIQEEILKDLELQYKKAGRAFIADRTPIDLMAYTLADVGRETLTKEQDDLLLAYMRRCADLCNKTFNVLVVVQPGIPLVEDPTKAPATHGYIEHISALVVGLVNQEMIATPHFFIKRSNTDIEARVSAVHYCVGRALERLEEKYFANQAFDGEPVYATLQ